MDDLILEVTNENKTTEPIENVCEKIGKSASVPTTKLRPEAPPFMPEKNVSLMKDQVTEMIKDPIESDESYFANVNLHERTNVAIEELLVSNLTDAKDTRKMPGLKPFSLISNMKRSSQRVQTTEVYDQGISTSANEITVVNESGQPITMENPTQFRARISQFTHENYKTLTIAFTLACLIALCLYIISSYVF